MELTWGHKKGDTEEPLRGGGVLQNESEIKQTKQKVKPKKTQQIGARHLNPSGQWREWGGGLTGHGYLPND